jgi:mitotic spindle assembly checkpoint protein MAD1
VAERGLAKSQAVARAAEREAEALGREAAGLQRRLGRGEFDVEKLKVLHLRANPEAAAREAAWAAERQALRCEAEALREAIAKADSAAGGSGGGGGGGAAGSGAPAAGVVAAAEASVLRHRLSEMEKREVRYKQVYGESIATVRDACRLIFGYTLELQLPGDTVHIRPAALPPPNQAGGGAERLSFRVRRGDAGTGREGSVELLPGPHESHEGLCKNVAAYITRFRSVPAFCANWTLELFNAQTAGG